MNVMAYRTADEVKKEFDAHPRRVLIITTTVLSEGKAVKAHLSNLEIVIGGQGRPYDYARFAEPAGEWLVVHTSVPQGNTDAAHRVSAAHQDFGRFTAVLLVGVAGSLKDDIPIGSVVIGDYVYNSGSAKVTDNETLTRPHSIACTAVLQNAAIGVVANIEWQDLICAPIGMSLPDARDYPCDFPPTAHIKAIASGEEVVAGGNSHRYKLIQSNFNDCAAVEMEGWGAMRAAHNENTPAITVRGISDLCAGKEPVADALNQPIAAAHAAAFAFAILSFRSNSVPDDTLAPDAESKVGPVEPEDQQSKQSRTQYVVNLDGSPEDWSDSKTEAVMDCIKKALKDEGIEFVRIEPGSVRLVVSLREDAAQNLDLERLQELISQRGIRLLGAAPLDVTKVADSAKKELVNASVDLLSWEKTLPGGEWIDRPEQAQIESRFTDDHSSAVLLGDPGSGKSALLSKIASELVKQGATVLALKADSLSPDIETEPDLQRELQLSALPSQLVLELARLQPVYIVVDQLDALASQLDLKSRRLNVILNLIRHIGGVFNVHIVLSARNFEYTHDVRLRAIEAEGVELQLPPWHEVQEKLTEAGVKADTWPEEAREVVRNPQALKTFIALADAGQCEPYTTYQAMLDQLWRERVASANDGKQLAELAGELAAQMAEEEALWLATSRFDHRIKELERLQSLGFVVSSENNLSVAFSHQTVFNYVLARTFVRDIGLLSNYVLERQDSLFIRAKAWSALNYLREADRTSYEREFLAIWNTQDLRDHLKLLLIEFIGQRNQPMEFEKACMSEVLASPKARILGFKAINGSPVWFDYLVSGAIGEAMRGAHIEAGQAIRILELNWPNDSDTVVRLINENWLNDPEKDTYTWITVSNCPTWAEDVMGIASTVLERTPISIWQVQHTAATVAVRQPKAATQLVRSKLDFLKIQCEKEKPAETLRALKALVRESAWHDMGSLAEAAATEFLENIWPWYIELFARVIDLSGDQWRTHTFPGQSEFDVNFFEAEGGNEYPDDPLIAALPVAVETLAKESPKRFVEWVQANSMIELMTVQRLIASGFVAAIENTADDAFEWVLQDDRRFQLGALSGHRSTTINLIGAAAPQWSAKQVAEMESAIFSYKPETPSSFDTPERRKSFADEIRATKKELLTALGIERITAESRELVRQEQRALGDRFERSISGGMGGFIGSPMDASEMAKANDREILNIFAEIPDDTDWDHPRDWMRGGNIQLSRAFAEFSLENPERAVGLIDHFQSGKQERAAGYALETLAEDSKNDNRVVSTFFDLHTRQFTTKEYRSSAARALEKIASRKREIDDQLIDILAGWLEMPFDTEETPDDDVEFGPQSDSDTDDAERRAILWGMGHSSMLPGGNYNTLSALATILLNRKEEGRDRYLKILDNHLAREQDPRLWKPLLHRLSNSGATTPEIVSTFVRKLYGLFPEIFGSREGVLFLARAQRWDGKLVYDLIYEWRASGHLFRQQAYGELVGLIATVKSEEEWKVARDEIVSKGTETAKIGLAFATVNLWREKDFRESSNETLVALLDDGSSEVAAAVMDVFRVVDVFPPDRITENLLSALSEPNVDVAVAPSHFVVEHLQSLLPHCAELIAKLAMKLVAAWTEKLRDQQFSIVDAAPQLTDLAITLHRLGGPSRGSGIRLFEALIEIDAYGARDILAEIDGRFDANKIVRRPRIPRRKRTRNRRARTRE